MRVLLIGVNLARSGGHAYSLALEYLRASAQAAGDLKDRVTVDVRNYNARAFEYNYALAVDAFYPVLHQISAWGPDLVGFSCYIWNIEAVLSLVPLIKKILPDVTIVLGGPEFDEIRKAERVLAVVPEVDVVVRREGEQTFVALLRTLLDGDQPLDRVDGLSFRAARGILSTPDRAPIADLNLIPSPYLDGGFDLSPFADPNSTILLETFRGCVYRCCYCNWSKQKIRAFSLERVKAEIAAMIAARVHNVYIIDSHFGMNAAAAKEIMAFIAQRNTGTQFDVYPFMGRYDEEYLAMAKDAGINFIGFGVQTTNPSALKRLQRPWKQDTFERNLAKIRELGVPFKNVDLVLGLPDDTYEGFRRSVEYCLALNPRYLHIHPLKVIAGSEFSERSQSFGILFSERPPYHVLATASMPFADLMRGKALACAVVAWYHHFPNTLSRLAILGGRPALDILEDFAQWACLDSERIPLSKSHSEAANDAAAERGYYQAIREYLGLRLDDASLREYLIEFLEYELLHPKSARPSQSQAPAEMVGDWSDYSLSADLHIRCFHYDFSAPPRPGDVVPERREHFYLFTPAACLIVTADLLDFLRGELEAGAREGAVRPPLSFDGDAGTQIRSTLLAHRVLAPKVSQIDEIFRRRASQAQEERRAEQAA